MTPTVSACPSTARRWLVPRACCPAAGDSILAKVLQGLVFRDRRVVGQGDRCLSRDRAVDSSPPAVATPPIAARPLTSIGWLAALKSVTLITIRFAMTCRVPCRRFRDSRAISRPARAFRREYGLDERLRRVEYCARRPARVRALLWFQRAP